MPCLLQGWQIELNDLKLAWNGGASTILFCHSQSTEVHKNCMQQHQNDVHFLGNTTVTQVNSWTLPQLGVGLEGWGKGRRGTPELARNQKASSIDTCMDCMQSTRHTHKIIGFFLK